MKKKKMGMERRTAVLYARVRPSIKNWLKVLAKQLRVSESEALDQLLSEARISRQ